MESLVRLRTRPSRDGKTFKNFLDYTDENGKRRQVSLRHADRRRAERQRAQKERELRVGTVAPDSMKLSTFLDDSLNRTRAQVREGTLVQYDIAMRHFIGIVGDIDFLKVEHAHGERFVQQRLDAGDSRATVNKKVRALRRLFQLAMERGQLDENPFRRVRRPKVPKAEVRVYSPDECERLARAARDISPDSRVRWDLLVAIALLTGMRRGEILNTTWRDIDFHKHAVRVTPKRNSEQTWEWYIKDTDRRTLPLTDGMLTLLADHQAEQLDGNPYAFVPSRRYEHIQQIRRAGKWTVRHGICPLNNFTRQWQRILTRASIEAGEFHDLRRTCLSRWLTSGLSEYEVMHLAGHADFTTTHRFYLAIRDDLLVRARAVIEGTMDAGFVAHLLRTPLQTRDRSISVNVSALHEAI